MNRDWDLVRKILLEIYNYPDDCLPHVEIEGYPRNMVMYHVKMLKDKGLIEAIDTGSHDGISYLNVCLTWDGQDFIEAAQNDTNWSKAKSTVIRTVGALSLEALKIVLKEMMTKPFLG